MLLKEKEQSMSRKEYLKKLKKSKKKFPLLKPILLTILMLVLFVYVIHQLHVYNTVTEMANKVVEETKLIKTYSMYFMGKPYIKDGKDNLLYLYTGSDESRLEIEEGIGLSNISVFGNYLYGIKNGNLHRIDLLTYKIETVCEENVLAYNVSAAGVFVYRYDKSDSAKTGIYVIKGKDKEELIINKSIYQLLVDDSYIYVVTEDNTKKTIVRFSFDGKTKKTLTDKILVDNIIQSDKYIYYTNSSNKNLIYKVSKDGLENVAVTKNSAISNTTKYNGNSIMGTYQDSLIYISNQENKVYMVTDGAEDILIDNEVNSIQLKDKMLYITLKNKIEIHRYNLEKRELEKITSARLTEFVFVNN